MSTSKNNQNKMKESTENITLSPEQLGELINKAVDAKIKELVPNTTTTNNSEITSVLTELTKAINKDEGVRKGTLKDYEIDTTDYLDEEELFFTYSFSYGIYGDVRYGQQVDTPYGRPIKFKPLYRYKKPGVGKHSDKMITTSVAKIRSKKEREFLTGHSLFGIKFFKSQNEVIDLDTAYADKLVEISYMLNAMSEHEIVTRARQEKIQIDTTNVDNIKKRLVHYLADKEIKSNRPKVGMPKPVESSWTPDQLDEVLDKNDY
jgi:hypothetical protein